MTRFSLTRLSLILSAVAAQGCRGQSVEGAWLGGFPAADSKDCEIKLQDDHRLSVSCQDTKLLAVGRYDWDGSTLSLELKLLSLGKVIVANKPSYKLKVSGHGNSIVLMNPDRTYSWHRIKL